MSTRVAFASYAFFTSSKIVVCALVMSSLPIVSFNPVLIFHVDTNHRKHSTYVNNSCGSSGVGA